MAHEWSPADLPSDFKLFEWDFARNDKVTLDANGGIASIADNWAGRLAVTTSTAARRTLATFTNGVQGAYKPGSSSNTAANGLSLIDTSGLPVGSADRYLGFAVVHADGILGGYGDTSHDYWLDTPFNPGYRVHLEGTMTTNQLSVNRTDAHFVELETISGVTTLWVDGVNAGTYNNVLATTASKFGIAGYDQSYYTMNGYTFYVPVGKRGRTTDERYLLQAWTFKYKLKRSPPSDNPYRPVANGGSDLPMVADSGTTVSGTGSAAGTGTASATGATTAGGTGSAAGTGLAAAASSATASGTGSASGSGTASGVGAASASGTGSTSGTGTAVATGSVTAGGTGAAVGTGTALAAGSTIAAATGTAAGSSTASASSGSQTTIGGTGTAAGSSIVTGLGAVRAGGTGTAVGSSTATSASGQTVGGTGTALGGSTAAATAAARTGGAGVAFGSSTVFAGGTSRAGGRGTALGTGRAFAYGARLQILARPPPSRTARSIVKYRVAVDPVRGHRAQ